VLIAMEKWKGTAIQAAVGVLLLVAFAGRLAWDMLQPLVPSLIAIVALFVVYGIIFRRRG
jgi:hypothetical protein